MTIAMLHYTYSENAPGVVSRLFFNCPAGLMERKLLEKQILRSAQDDAVCLAQDDAVRLAQDDAVRLMN